MPVFSNIKSTLSTTDPFYYVRGAQVDSSPELGGPLHSLYGVFLTVFITGITTTIILGFIMILLSNGQQRNEAKKNIIFKLFLVSAFASVIPGCGLLIEIITRIF